MLQKKYSISEPRFMCNICSKAIINPLCPFCLSTEIEAWLTYYPNLRQELLPRIKKYLYTIESKLLEATNCLKCNRRASLCPYCFTEFVLNELKKIHVNRIVLREFFEFFNFDFEHTGYSKEAEKLGVI